MRYSLAFVGAGNMAEALARAAFERGVLTPESVIAADPNEQRRALFHSLGAAVTDDNAEAISSAGTVVLAIKPQGLGKAQPDLARVDGQKQVLVSVLAGVSTKRLEEGAGKTLRAVRVMPNTPMLAGAGMAAVAVGAHARDGDEALALRLCSAAGEAVRVEEAQMDAVTAVSGSGPAYVFYLAEAMEHAAEELGLDAAQRQQLVPQTIRGAAALLQASDKSAAALRQQVMSPGGTTEAAIQRLEEAGVGEALRAAVRAAHDRSNELGG